MRASVFTSASCWPLRLRLPLTTVSASLSWPESIRQGPSLISDLGGRRTGRTGSIHKRTPTALSNWKLPSEEGRQDWLRKDLRVVLVHPACDAVIPQNVGNIARTCAATAIGLHLVEPLGFEVNDRKLKRAGLDYWPFVAVETHASWEAFCTYFEELPGPKRMLGFSKYASSGYAEDGLYCSGDWLLFGAETTGLPKEAHEYIPSTGGKMLKIPMVDAHVRSLNLAVSVGVGAYEAIRQLKGRQA